MLMWLLALVLSAQAARPAQPQTAKPVPQTTKPAPAQPAKPAAPTLFTSPYSLDEMRGKQAVVDTTVGTFVIQLLPEAAPNHVALFMKLARDGQYTRTIFHRVIGNAVIQGGDPLSKDPAKAAD